MFMLSLLPPEVQHKILVDLEGISLAQAECVCKLWYDILKTPPFNIVWRRECLYDIEECVLVELTGIEDILLVSELRFSGRSGDHVKRDTRVWKTVYSKWYTCKKMGNWPVIVKDINKAAEVSEVHHVQFSGDVIFTGHSDSRIRLWDSWTGACLQTLSGHRGPVTCIALYHKPVKEFALESELRLPELMASGSEDAEVRIWNVKTGSCQAIFANNSTAVTCLRISNQHVISASFDGIIFLWDLFKNNLCTTINTKDSRGHFNPILYLSVWKRTAMSVDQTEIKFWSLDTGDCIQCLKHDDCVTSRSVGCILRNSRAVLVKDDGELRYWDLNRFSSAENEPHLKYRLLNFQTTKGSCVACFTTYGNLLALGTEAGMVFIFHYDRDWSEQPTKIHHQVNTGCLGLRCITLSHDGEGPLLVTGHSNGLIKIFRWFSPWIS